MSQVYEFIDFLEAVPVEFSDLAGTPVGKAAKREGLSFKETQRTHWIRLDMDGEPVGVGALIEAGKKSRLKSVYVTPEWRRQGFFMWMGLQITLMARQRGYTALEAIVRPASKAALLKVGWDEVKHNLVQCNPQALLRDGETATQAFRRLVNGEEVVS